MRAEVRLIYLFIISGKVDAKTGRKHYKRLYSDDVDDFILTEVDLPKVCVFQWLSTLGVCHKTVKSTVEGLYGESREQLKNIDR